MAEVPQLPVLQLPELEEDDVLQQPMSIYPYLELKTSERQRIAGKTRRVAQTASRRFAVSASTFQSLSLAISSPTYSTKLAARPTTPS